MSGWNLEVLPTDPVEGWDAGYVRIGSGELGGKANGLVFFNDMLQAEYDASKFSEIDVAVPSFAVLTTDVFDAFVQTNGLADIARGVIDDEEIAAVFQAATLPDPVRETLAALVEHVRVPLAVRSSSVLEDAIFCPFAGVYETKMIPNNDADVKLRLERLELAIKLVFASTFYGGARSAREAMGKSGANEKMAVIVQEIVGNRSGDRFYPVLSGVARSHHFYATCGSKPEDGVVNLALGLGRTIVDGGNAWPYSPKRPKAPPPFGSTAELLKNTQTDFWSVNLASQQAESPTDDGEFMVQAGLAEAEADGKLGLVASTYDGRSDRLLPGTGASGPRVLNFAPILSLGLLPLNDALRELMAICERAAGGEVEIEFALRAAEGESGRPLLGFLQVRPMVVSHETVTIRPEEWSRDDLVLASKRAMGNGIEEQIRDVVFVKPDTFEGRHTPVIADELRMQNLDLVARGRPYLLIGFGRWGSSDPWLGIPVDWSQICGARVIVEATLPEMNVDPSEGSHFFHNISSCGVGYLTVHHDSSPGIDWNWLHARPARADTRFVRHVELPDPVVVKIDGRSGQGAIWRRASSPTAGVRSPRRTRPRPAPPTLSPDE